MIQIYCSLWRKIWGNRLVFSHNVIIKDSPKCVLCDIGRLCKNHYKHHKSIFNQSMIFINKQVLKAKFSNQSFFYLINWIIFKSITFSIAQIHPNLTHGNLCSGISTFIAKISKLYSYHSNNIRDTFANIFSWRGGSSNVLMPTR